MFCSYMGQVVDKLSRTKISGQNLNNNHSVFVGLGAYKGQKSGLWLAEYLERIADDS